MTGLGVGRRLRAGKRGREICLRVYVTRKQPLAAIAPRARLPALIHGVPVDVIEADFVGAACRAEAWLRREARDPLQGGIEIRNAAVAERGTLGLLLRAADGADYGLTCEHVAPTGASVVQPGQGARRVGRVSAGRRDGTADLDAALVRLAPPPPAHAGGLYAAAAQVSVSAARPKEGQGVRVVGACSGRVAGVVHEDSHATYVTYLDRAVQYQDQVLIDAEPTLVRQGDSGALVLDASGTKAWGILIAVGGPGQHRLGVVTPLTRILAHADFQVAGQPLAPLP